MLTGSPQEVDDGFQVIKTAFRRAVIQRRCLATGGELAAPEAAAGGAGRPWPWWVCGGHSGAVCALSPVMPQSGEPITSTAPLETAWRVKEAVR